MPIEQATTSPTLSIHSGQGDYDVISCESLASVASLAHEPNAMAIIDENVLAIYPSLLEMFGADRIHTLSATEDEKTLQGVERACQFLQHKMASKQSHLVVIGGGITQDVGTFVSHIYYRGIPFTFVPTTLLAMADSCIGAKCAVNLGDFKNQLGFFQSPKRVMVWSGFLESLSPEDVRSGFGEIVKLAIISGPRDFEWLESRLSSVGFSLESVDQAIFRSLETKKSVIEKDEYEANLRKTLNYGHTFGHALESLTHREVPHGLAVAWGIDVANYVAMRLGILESTLFERIHSVLAQHFTVQVREPYNAAELIAAMHRDKKASSGKVTLILPEQLGNLRLVPHDLDSTLESYVAAYIAEYDIFS